MKTRLFFVLAAAGLAACNTPSARFYGAERMEIHSKDADFYIFLLGDEAQVIRVSSSFGKTKKELIFDSVEALNMATDCDIDLVPSHFDDTVINFEIECA